jgi:hypothetical protein
MLCTWRSEDGLLRPWMGRRRRLNCYSSALLRGLEVHTKVADLTAPEFIMLPDTYDLVLIAYYLQRDLFAKVKTAVPAGGVVATIVHTPDTGERWSAKRARPGELRGFFNGWEVLWDYEGPSRDPAHSRPVAEIVARRVTSHARRANDVFNTRRDSPLRFRSGMELNRQNVRPTLLSLGRTHEAQGLAQNTLAQSELHLR